MARQGLRHLYLKFRRHQLDTYGNSGEHIDGVDQRKFTGGGAAYGYHALAAYWQAQRHLHFLLKVRRKGTS